MVDTHFVVKPWRVAWIRETISTSISFGIGISPLLKRVFIKEHYSTDPNKGSETHGCGKLPHPSQIFMQNPRNKTSDTHHEKKI
jgi:hypothetical protein